MVLKKFLVLVFIALVLAVPIIIKSYDFEVINAYTSIDTMRSPPILKDANSGSYLSIFGNGLGHEFVTGEDATQTTMHMSYLSAYFKFGFMSLFFIPIVGAALLRQKGPMKDTNLLVFWVGGFCLC